MPRRYKFIYTSAIVHVLSIIVFQNSEQMIVEFIDQVPLNFQKEIRIQTVSSKAIEYPLTYQTGIPSDVHSPNNQTTLGACWNRLLTQMDITLQVKTTDSRCI